MRFKNPLKPLSEPPSLYNLPHTPSLSSVTPQSRGTLELRLGAEEAFPSGLNTPSSMEILPPSLALWLPALRPPFSHPLPLLWGGGSLRTHRQGPKAKIIKWEMDEDYLWVSA